MSCFQIYKTESQDLPLSRIIQITQLNHMYILHNMHTHIQRERKRDRQIDRQTDTHTHTHTERHIHTLRERHTHAVIL